MMEQRTSEIRKPFAPSQILAKSELLHFKERGWVFPGFFFASSLVPSVAPGTWQVLENIY